MAEIFNFIGFERKETKQKRFIEVSKSSNWKLKNLDLIFEFQAHRETTEKIILTSFAFELFNIYFFIIFYQLYNIQMAGKS